jgi:hypothetical protein
VASEDAESHSDLLALGAVEPAPESRPFHLSLNTQFESGIPPAGQRHGSGSAALFGRELSLEDGIQRMNAALGDAVRTEVNIGLLMRGLKHLTAGAEAARTANTKLLLQLDELRTHLTHSQEEEHALRFRMHQLERILNLIGHETAREREFLIEQQDQFLLEILTDHERQLDAMRAGAWHEQQSNAQKIEELIAQRDQAREYATRCERERDLARQELAAGIATPHKSPVAPEHGQRGPSPETALASLNLRSAPVPVSGTEPDTERSSERPATGGSSSRDDLGE